MTPCRMELHKVTGLMLSRQASHRGHQNCYQIFTIAQFDGVGLFKVLF